MTLGWAILGTGAVSKKFAHGLSYVGDKVVAVGTRDIQRGTDFLASLAPDVRAAESSAMSVLEAISKSGVDAVYLATPPALHESHALLASTKRRAILIEKPFAVNADAAMRIATAARSANVFCMEALWTRFMPMTNWLSESVSSGALGEVRAFQADFMGSDEPDVGQSLFNPSLGGGVLLHRAIYPISLALKFFGSVSDVKAVGRIGETGVEEEATIVLVHNSGVISTLRASVRAGGSNGMTISGTEATLLVDPPIYRPFRAKFLRHGVRRGGTSGRAFSAWREGKRAQALNRLLSAGTLATLLERNVVHKPYIGNGYPHEAEEVARALKSGIRESPLMPLDESIAVLRLIDEARVQIFSKSDLR